MEMPNEEDFIDKLEQSILDIQAKCNYFVPQFIIDEWGKSELKEGTNKKSNLADFKEHTDHNISMFYEADDDENDDDDDKSNTKNAAVTDTNNAAVTDTNNSAVTDTNNAAVTDTNNKKDTLKINESTYLLENKRPTATQPIKVIKDELRNEPHIEITINEADLDSFHGSDVSSYTLSPDYINQNKSNPNLKADDINLNSEDTNDNRSTTI